MGFWGADTEGLLVFASSCRAGARSMSERLEVLDTAVNGVDWVGPDADQVRTRWSSEISPSMRRIVAMLETRDSEVSSHAEEQEHASTPDGSAFLGTPPTGTAARIGQGATPLDAVPLSHLMGVLGPPNGSAWSTGARDGSLRQGMGISSEIGGSGIAPGEPDPIGSIWDWVFGKRDSPLPDLPGGDKEEPADPVPAPGDGDRRRDEEPPNPADGPQKPANWPDDMPWPPAGPTGEQGEDGQYVYGDEGYGSPGDATRDDRPVGTAVDEGDQGGVDVGTDDGGVAADGQWTVNGGTSVTEDEHSNFTVTAGGRAGIEGRANAGSSDGTGAGIEGSAEIYAEGGVTVGNDGYGTGWRAGGQAGGSASYAETNDDGSSSIYTVEARAEAGAHSSHYGYRVRNADGESTGWATGFSVGAGASVGYNYTEEWVSPNGWMQTSVTTSDSAGRSVGLSGNAVITTDELSISVGGGLPGMPSDMPSGFAIGINPNKIVSDVSGGAFDADDVVKTMHEHSPYNNPRQPLWA